MSLPFPIPTDADAVDSAAHLIQIALTPVFMLSGIGTLINVFNTRLARVADHLESVNQKLATPPDPDSKPDPLTDPIRLQHQQLRLHRRIFVLDAAIMLNAVGGASTCGAAMALFVGSLRDASTSTWLLVLFGIALACTIGALSFFLADTLLSWHGLKRDSYDLLELAAE
ncbi:DUF2721 domain-containing protein [Gluconobacter morbifer]|uniref:DUF2721 domain-containing protein n=1 Tax=Gluconobacter morbifer G707 TaxID=1088869 RepID=G6XK67_9PROT|nr:DUF2721 domain-containing protein [Gluconobacter morbifer]EHH68029.1 hypothetical protein GMO_17960 [Gluconobacter morbifer G707]